MGIFAATGAGLTVQKPTDSEAEDLAHNQALREALAAASESYTPAQANGLLRGGRS